MGGSSSPEDMLEDVWSGVEKVGKEYLDIATDVALLGQRDEIIEAGTEGLKEITGAAAAEEANALARQQIEEERQRALEDRQRMQDESARDQLLASRRASSSRSSANRSSTSRGGSRYSSLGSDEVDFLGL